MAKFIPMEKHSKPDKIDHIIDDALSTPPELSMPDTFTERFMQRLEKRIALRNVLFDFGLKVMVLVGVVLILAVVFFIINWDKKLENIVLVNFLLENIVPISMVLIGVAFTFFIDQVLLRYFSRRHNVNREW